MTAVGLVVDLVETIINLRAGETTHVTANQSGTETVIRQELLCIIAYLCNMSSFYIKVDFFFFSCPFPLFSSLLVFVYLC